jgi:hypothetical protein
MYYLTFLATAAPRGVLIDATVLNFTKASDSSMRLKGGAKT